MQTEIDRKKKTLTLRIDAKMFELLKQKADEDMRTVSSYIRKVLKKAIQNNNTKK
jgi:hypothetical protein